MATDPKPAAKARVTTGAVSSIDDARVSVFAPVTGAKQEENDIVAAAVAAHVEGAAADTHALDHSFDVPLQRSLTDPTVAVSTIDDRRFHLEQKLDADGKVTSEKWVEDGSSVESVAAAEADAAESDSK